MTSLFGLPMDRIMAVLLAVCLALSLLLGGLALRNRILVALAWRTIPRRRLQTALIVTGLMLSTAIITSSLTTGDTMSFSARSIIADSLGRIDEIIVAQTGGEGARLGPDGLAGVTNGEFSADQYAALRPRLLAIPGVAGVAPALSEVVSLVDATSRQSKEKVTLIALPPDYDPTFGAITSLDGRPLTLAQLGPGEIYLNREGADALGAQPGDSIRLYFGSTPLERRLKAVVRNGGPGGSQPAVLAPLAQIQAARGEAGRINQIYVANRGDALSGDRWIPSVTAAIRPLLIDDGVARQLAAILARPGTAEALAGSAALRPATKAKLAELVAEAKRTPPDGAPSDRFKALLGDRGVLYGLGVSSYRLPDRAAGADIIPLLYRVAAVSVTDVKHQGLQAADTVGGAITSIFVGLGLFSIASGTLLIFLIFVMLAAERRTEMGVARAIGTQRGHLVQLFLFEGALYDLAAGLVGVLIGLAVGLGTVALISALLSAVDLRLRFHVEPRSLVIAFCLGLLLTFGTVAASAWRVSRLNIVAAIRNLPDAAQHSRRRGGATALLAPALAAFGLGFAQFSQGRPALLPVQALATSLAIVGLALTARLLLALLRVPEGPRDRLCFTAAGLALLVYWASPYNMLHTMRPADLQRGVELYFLAGLGMVGGAVWAVVYNADAAILPLAALGGRVFPLAAALRTAAAYALRQRFRSGMALAMFALVVFTMVVAAVLSSASNTAYGDFGAAEGGFDIRGDARVDRPVPDLQRALAAAPGVKPSDFAAADRVTTIQG